MTAEFYLAAPVSGPGVGHADSLSNCPDLILVTLVSRMTNQMIRWEKGFLVYWIGKTSGYCIN